MTDLTLCLQANLYPRILAAMKPGSTLGLSHGFLLGVMKNDDADFREDINVVLVAPKVGACSLWQANLLGCPSQVVSWCIMIVALSWRRPRWMLIARGPIYWDAAPNALRK